MWLAARHDVLLISADSRQVYRGFDVGTAKPTREELKRVPHRGIDVVDPTERYSAAAWVTMARAAIAETHASHRTPVIVGGTGFYVSALFQPLWEEPELDAKARRRLQSALDGMSLEELRRWCERLDPARAHLGRTQLLRAIEIALMTGRRISDLHASSAKGPSYRPRYLLVDPGLQLPTRIAARAAGMIDGGWLVEVHGLLKTVPESAPAWNAAGYRTIRQLPLGEIDRTTALERVTIDTRQFAKRQRTWFRNQLDNSRVERLVSDAPGWEDAVERWFTEASSTMPEARSTKHEAPSTKHEAR